MSTVTQQAAPRTKAYDPLTGEKWRLAKRMSSFYVLLIPPVVLLFIFHYIPIYGAVIAFKDFHYGKGILGSPWNDFLHFERLFQNPFFFRVLRNSILINVLHLVFGFPAPILLALLVNEVAHTAFRKTCQTISYLPHFVSWVVLATIVRQLLHPTFGVAAYAFQHPGHGGDQPPRLSADVPRTAGGHGDLAGRRMGSDHLSCRALLDRREPVRELP